MLEIHTSLRREKNDRIGEIINSYVQVSLFSSASSDSSISVNYLI